MPRDERVEQICEAIDQQVLQMLASPMFLDWPKRPDLQPATPDRSGDLIVFNNSYLRREKVKRKSNKYLCISVDGNATPAVVRPLRTRFDSSLTRIAAPSLDQFHIVDIHNAVETELDQLGSIVLSLVGQIADDQTTSVEMATGSHVLTTLRFEPTQATVATIEQDVLQVNRLDD